MRSYHNLEHKQTYERGQRKNWYRGWGADGYNYIVEVFIKNPRNKQHYRARPVATSSKPISSLPNTFYGRTLEDISKKLESLK